MLTPEQIRNAIIMPLASLDNGHSSLEEAMEHIVTKLVALPDPAADEIARLKGDLAHLIAHVAKRTT